MHEAGLAARFVEAVLEEAGRHGAGRVRAAGARIGELHGVVDHHLTGFFSAMVAGTPAEGARLVIERVAATAACRDCGTEITGARHFRHCPACGSARLDTVTGLEMQLSWLEIE